MRPAWRVEALGDVLSVWGVDPYAFARPLYPNVQRASSAFAASAGDVHSRFVKVVGGFLGLLLGAFIGLIGLFLILYTGDQGAEQDIYVSAWGTPRVDADFVGIPLVVIALALVVVCLRALRRGGIP